MTKPSYLQPDEGRRLRVGPFAFVFKAGHQTESGYTFAEVTVPPAAQNGPHLHPCEETMYVLAGVLEFFDADGERHRLTAGASVHVPANTSHGYINATTSDARLLVVAPIGQEDVFSDLALAAGDPARVAAAMARHGVVPTKARAS
jgi:quercetin dioxygenase-like cupin family protein